MAKGRMFATCADGLDNYGLWCLMAIVMISLSTYTLVSESQHMGWVDISIDKPSLIHWTVVGYCTVCDRSLDQEDTDAEWHHE